MKLIFCLLFIWPLLGKAQLLPVDNNLVQQEVGIKWIRDMTWQEIKAKAKAENKPIFVDCNATWCKPCKIMDRDVFVKDTVGDLINNNFIAVKVQVDTGKSDDASTRKLYAAAREFEKQYKITGIPTFLFFSPNGNIVHKNVGGKKVDEFINEVQEGMDSSLQLYTLLKRCREGKVDYNILPFLIKQFDELGDKAIANELARLYMKNYLEQLPENLFVLKSNLMLMVSYQHMLTYDDRIYQLSRQKPAILDSSSDIPDLAAKLIKSIIIDADVAPVIQAARESNREPDWQRMRMTISWKTDPEKTEEILLDAQLYWYAIRKNWSKYSHYYFIRACHTDLSKIASKEMLIYQLNTFAWDLFLYSSNKKHLGKAIVWVDEAIELREKDDPRLLDTKANLLYKLGKKKQAIEIQERAVSLLQGRGTGIHAALDKMKRGVRTW